MNFNELDVQKTKGRRTGGNTRTAQPWDSPVRFKISNKGKKSFQFNEAADSTLGLNNGIGFVHFVNRKESDLPKGVYIALVPEDDKMATFFTTPKKNATSKSLEVTSPVLEDHLVEMGVISTVSADTIVENKPNYQYLSLVKVEGHASKIEGCPAQISAVYQLVLAEVTESDATSDSVDESPVLEEAPALEAVAEEEDDEFSFD